MSDPLTATECRKVLHYNPETGIFTRLISATNSVKIGDVAGSRNSCQYIAITINGKKHQAHRLAWLYMTGEWPKHFIDHKDTCRSNNIWTNLREATHQQNKQNAPIRRDNKSGFKGVCWLRPHKKWRARIKANGREIHLGYFNTREAAHAAYCEAAPKHHGEFARIT